MDSYHEIVTAAFPARALRFLDYPGGYRRRLNDLHDPCEGKSILDSVGHQDPRRPDHHLWRFRKDRCEAGRSEFVLPRRHDHWSLPVAAVSLPQVAGNVFAGPLGSDGSFRGWVPT